jgi:hypothetical protein
MEAREGGVLVRQGRRLERPVPARVLRHRVDEPRIGEPWGGNGERCEEDKPDQGRDEHGVSEDEVVLSMPPVEEDRCRRDDRPVAVDVDPVGRSDERVVIQNGRLNRRSPCDPEAVFKPCDRVSVRKGGPGASFRRTADREVREDEDRDDEDLPRHRLECPKRKWKSKRRHNASVPRAGGVGIRAGPQRSLWGSTHRESVRKIPGKVPRTPKRPTTLSSCQGTEDPGIAAAANAPVRDVEHGTKLRSSRTMNRCRH